MVAARSRATAFFHSVIVCSPFCLLEVSFYFIRRPLFQNATIFSKIFYFWTKWGAGRVGLRPIPSRRCTPRGFHGQRHGLCLFIPTTKPIEEDLLLGVDVFAV